MFCPHCGSEIKDGSRFCTECGQALPAAGEEPAAGAGVTSGIPTPEQAGLGAQVSEVRGKAKRQMPLFMIVVLVALGVATLAFAVTMLVRYVVVPSLQHQQEPVEAVSEQAATEEVPAETEAPATTEPEPAGSTADATAQQAVFDGILAQYKAAQDRGWTVGANDGTSLQALESGAGVQSANLTEGGVVYAYYKLAGSNEPALLIASNGDGGANILAVYTSSNGQPIDNDYVASMSRGYWSVVTNGQLLYRGRIGGSGAPGMTNAVLYSVVDGQLKASDSFETDGSTYRRIDGSGAMSAEEFSSAYPSAGAADIEWQPLSSYAG